MKLFAYYNLIATHTNIKKLFYRLNIYKNNSEIINNAIIEKIICIIM